MFKWILKAGILAAFAIIVLTSTFFYFFYDFWYNSQNFAVNFMYGVLLIVIWGVFLKQVYILWRDTYEGIEHMGLNFSLMLALAFSFAFVPLIDFGGKWLFSIGPLIGLFFVWGVFLYFYSNYNTQERLEKDCLEEVKAKVVDIEYSNKRVNNKLLFNLVVEYEGVTSKIKNLPSDTHSKVNIGDKIKVKYNPDNKMEVILDLDDKKFKKK